MEELQAMKSSCFVILDLWASVLATYLTLS